MSQIGDVQLETGGEAGSATPEHVVRNQVARIVNAIETDEQRRSKVLSWPRRNIRFAPSRVAGLAMAASITLAVAVGAWLMINVGHKSPLEEAKLSLIATQNSGRMTLARVTGLPYAAENVERSGDNKSLRETQIQVARTDAKNAEAEMASTEAALVHARTYLIDNRAEEALDMLLKLPTSGDLADQLFNDIGVAYLQLRKYDDAIAAFERALQISPGMQEPLFNRALAREAAANVAADENRTMQLRRQALEDWQEFIVSSSADDQWKEEARLRRSDLQELIR
jgi:tetratricopeptide (TPR) repeat protein